VPRWYTDVESGKGGDALERQPRFAPKAVSVTRDWVGWGVPLDAATERCAFLIRPGEKMEEKDGDNSGQVRFLALKGTFLSHAMPSP
jgi:hypothetical protein